MKKFFSCRNNKVIDESIINKKHSLESIKLKNNFNNVENIRESTISTKQNTIDIDIISLEKKLDTQKLYKLLHKKIVDSFNKSIIKKNDEAIIKNNYKSKNSITPYVDIEN